VKWYQQLVIAMVLFMLVGLVFRGGCPAAQPMGAPPGARIVEVVVAGRPGPGEERLSPASFTIRAEVADTQQKRRQGLVGRRGLAPGHGMLYVYEEPSTPPFDWSAMKFPVSVAFIAPDGTIVDIHRAAAGDPGEYSPPNPIRYALEVRAGWFQDRGITPGDRLILPPELAAQPATPPADESDEEAPAAPPGSE